MTWLGDPSLQGGVCCLQFDNETLYSGSWDMCIMAWDLVSFQRRAVLNGHRGSISAIRMNKEVMWVDSMGRGWGEEGSGN